MAFPPRPSSIRSSSLCAARRRRMASRGRRAARPGGVFYGAIRGFTNVVKALFTRSRIVGMEHVPRTGGVLVVSSHASNADPVILMAVMPRPLAFMTKEELFRPRLIRTFLQLWRGAFPVRRGK